jgi:hypothetical protein
MTQETQETQEKAPTKETREQLIFTYKPNDKNPDYYCIGLLKERKIERGIVPKQSILEAMRAFWLPIACLRAEKYSEDCLTEMFWESLAKLNAQQELLWNTVGKALNLERPQLTVGTQEVLSTNNNQISSTNKSPKTGNNYSGLDYDDQGLL